MTRRLPIFWPIQALALAVASVATPTRADCFSDCDSRYYLCLGGGASVGERACSTSRSICYMGCKRYGAIAFSRSSREHGYSFRHDSRAAAEARALAECRGRPSAPKDCSIVVWFYDRCGALAVSDKAPYGSTHGRTKREAEQFAIRYCAQAGGNSCHAVLAFCSIQ